MSISRQERYHGCLVGLAVGDAVGTTVEFKQPGLVFLHKGSYLPVGILNYSHNYWGFRIFPYVI